jgi:predicted nucleotidyltransferase
MILNLNNNEDLKEVFDALEEAFVNTGIDYFLIGAQARDHWYQKGGKTSRQTRDVDIAVLVGSQEEYNQVRHYLEEHKSYQGTKDNSFVMITPGRIQVDILPFGEIEIDDAVVMAGEGLTSIKVNGFMEVYKTGTHSIELGEGRIFKVATLPAIILLKFVAYDDRPEKRMKDAGDIANIIDNFFELQSDHIYENHADIFTAAVDNMEMEEISAIAIGKEINSIIANNNSLKVRILSILDKHLALKSESRFLRHMLLSENDTIEKRAKLLQHIRDGIV